MRVLTACYEEKTEACTEAVSVLRSPLWLLAGYSVMDVASEAHLMYFLSQPACQEAATKLWSGALDPTVPAWRVRRASYLKHSKRRELRFLQFICFFSYSFKHVFVVTRST